jgi:MSHA pilin protein MshD
MLNRFHRQHGASLIELVMFIVIIGIALAGILQVMDTVTGRSADTLIRKQSLAIAESLLEEIELQDFIAASGVTACPPNPTPNPVTQANRASGYHIVCDYNGFNMPAVSPP